ncbi:MAG TPA: carboxymuconolactone decarboxylase family protein [Candidatus Binatia bacterium]|nr:carboxymuconolactone decarboxylase family protein [Candidatus Binatia bacterium]
MIPHPTAPRLRALPPAEWTDDVKDILGRVPSGDHGPLNIFTTLAHHAGLLKRWLPFGTALLMGELPPRDRELLILRTAFNCGADYEWGQHAKIALLCGVTEAEVARVPAGAGASGWDPFDAALLRAADELHGEACISDATWKALAARYDAKQLVEVPMLVGQYHMVAFALNSLGVQREPGVDGLPR